MPQKEFQKMSFDATLNYINVLIGNFNEEDKVQRPLQHIMQFKQ